MGEIHWHKRRHGTEAYEQARYKVEAIDGGR